MNNIKCALRGSCNQRKGIFCTTKEQCSYKVFNISEESLLPKDVQEAINTFGRYGIVLKVNNNFIQIEGNNKLNLKDEKH